MLSGDNSILRRSKQAAKDEISTEYNSAFVEYLTNRYVLNAVA